MISYFSHTPSEVIEKEPGTGGRPPVDHRPTGGNGGGDDGWNEDENPHELLDHVRMMLAIFLTFDLLMVVLVMAATLGHFSTITQALFSSSYWHGLPPLLFLNAVLLLFSCLSMEQGRRQIFREIDVLEEWLGLGKPALRRALPWLGITLGLGGWFLLNQLFLLRKIAHATPEHLRLNSLYPLAAGIHGAHIGIGIGALIFCLFGMTLFHRVEVRQIVIDSVAWFWHATTLSWIILLIMMLPG